MSDLRPIGVPSVRTGAYPVPEADWATVVTKTRRLGVKIDGPERDRHTIPISEYEPCEVCGTRVVAVEVFGGREVVEITRLFQRHPITRSKAGTVYGQTHVNTRTHECKGRPL